MCTTYEYFGYYLCTTLHCDQCTLKGGVDDVSDIFGSLRLRVPLHFPTLLQK